MNELKEKDKISYEPELHRDAYRRGARRQTKGNLTLAIVVILLAAVVIVGILFVFKVFFGTDDLLSKKVGDVNQSAVLQNTENAQKKEDADLQGFDTALGGKVFYEGFSVKKASDAPGFSFESGILNYKIKDIDSDGENELFSVAILDDGSLEMSVYEKTADGCKRSGYYLFMENMFENSEDFQSDIYITESDKKSYICKESCIGDTWELTVFEYDGSDFSFAENIIVKDNNYTDEISEKLKKYSLEYSGKDYTNSPKSILNSKTHDFVCGASKSADEASVSVR